MTDHKASQQLKNSILLYSAVGIFVISIFISLIAVIPLYKALKAGQRENLVHEVQIKSMIVEEFIARARDTARQITSRTQIRKKLEAFNRQEITLSELQSFSASKLADAMNLSEDVVGITRLDHKNRPAVIVGTAIPESNWPIPGPDGTDVPILGPITLDNNLYIVLGAPIQNKKPQRVGTDIVLFKIQSLKNLIADSRKQSETGDTILAKLENQQAKLFFPQRGAATSSNPSIPKQSPLNYVITQATKNQSGLVDFTSDQKPAVVAYGPIQNGVWALLVKMDEAELYYSVNHLLGSISLGVLLMILFGTGGMLVLLRPLTGKILLRTEDLEAEVDHKTAELKSAYEKLQDTQVQLLQQEKMASVGQLAAGVAHEINNPLGFITSNINSLKSYLDKLLKLISFQSELIASTSSEELNTQLQQQRKKMKIDYIIEDLEELLEESLDGAERVKKIVQDLKTFSRVDAADCSAIDINECLENTLNIVNNELKYKATIRKDFADIPTTYCYPQQLGQVFLNLLVNAGHAIEEQGEIVIRTWQENDLIQISVSDTGQGIPAEIINRVFEPFFTTKEVGKGTGLGLSISYEIIKKHQGEFHVESVPGEGTTCTIQLPILSEKPASDA